MYTLILYHVPTGVNAGMLIRIENVLSDIEADIFTKVPAGLDRTQMSQLLNKIQSLEQSGAKPKVSSFGSIFIGLYCPNRQSLDILKGKLDNGQLKKDIMGWLEIEHLRHKYNVESLDVIVNLKVLGKSQSLCSFTCTTVLLFQCCWSLLGYIRLFVGHISETALPAAEEENQEISNSDETRLFQVNKITSTTSHEVVSAAINFPLILIPLTPSL